MSSGPTDDVASAAEREGIVDQQGAVLEAMKSADSRELAVVTGASSGIRLELSRQFVEHGFDLVIAAEDQGIDRAAADLRSSGGQVTGVQADLATADGVEELARRITALGRPVDAVAINAGVGVAGRFVGVRAVASLHGAMAKPGSGNR